VSGLIGLYAWTIPAAAVFGTALALLGCQLAARERVLQTFCLSQSALVGVLLGLGLSGAKGHDDPGFHALPLVLSFIFSLAVYGVTEWTARTIRFSRSTFFATVFALLLSLTYLSSVFFPALESHVANMFFGDLATLTEFDSKVTLGFGVIAVVLLTLFRRTITDRSFSLAVFDEKSAGSARADTYFQILTMAALCYAVQFLGFLFTISMLFLPTTLFAMDSRKGLRAHFRQVAIVTTFGVTGGFLLSLRFSRLPTTPTIALVVTALASAWLLAGLLRRPS
jgi:ABC-type Mn2+/Zn2+ transport system permease subunit